MGQRIRTFTIRNQDSNGSAHPHIHNPDPDSNGSAYPYIPNPDPDPGRPAKIVDKKRKKKLRISELKVSQDFSWSLDVL